MVALVASLTFAFGAVPAFAADSSDDVFAASTLTADAPQQSLNTDESAVPSAQISSVLTMSEAQNSPHGFDVEASIAAAAAEIGTSRATGWSQPGECIMSAQRWILAGGGAWTGSGDPVSNYTGALRLSVADAEPGDIIQYEYVSSPTSWVSGIHTVLVTGVNDDGTFQIIESNNPAGSGLVTANTSWVPAPPAGFQAIAWRF